MKLAKIIALIVSMLLIAGMLAACGDTPADAGNDTPANTGPQIDNTSLNSPTAGIEGVDFADGNIGFLAPYYKPYDATDGVSVELTEFKSANAAKITPVAGYAPYIVIDVSGLLGGSVTDVATVEIGIGSEGSDGSFCAVSGEILVFNNWEEQTKKGKWSAYIETRNPNIAIMDIETNFSAGDGNLIVIYRKDDNAEKGDTNIFITKIGFKDANGSYLTVDTGAVFSPPEGFNESIGYEIELKELTQDNSFHKGWFTNGVDSKETSYESEDFRKATTFVIELAEPLMGIPVLDDDGNETGEYDPFEIQVVWHGDSNNWNWAQADGIVLSTGGTTIEIDLPSTLQEFEQWKTSESTKFYIGFDGTFEDIGIIRTYFIAYEN